MVRIPNRLSIQNKITKRLYKIYDLFKIISLSPRLDLIEDDKYYKIETEMPGIDENNVKITLDDKLLTIHGEKFISPKDVAKNYIVREINYGHYLRSIALPLAVDIDKVTTICKKGVMWITIPKKTNTKLKRSK